MAANSSSTLDLGDYLPYLVNRVGTIIADHTGVPPQYRGQGIAEQLVKAAMEHARDTGGRIVPVCSYVVAQFRRHPEWADLQA